MREGVSARVLLLLRKFCVRAAFGLEGIGCLLTDKAPLQHHQPLSLRGGRADRK